MRVGRILFAFGVAILLIIPAFAVKAGSSVFASAGKDNSANFAAGVSNLLVADGGAPDPTPYPKPL